MTQAKPMTEREAWLELARLSRRERALGPLVELDSGGSIGRTAVWNGLCGAIVRWELADRIAWGVMRQMGRKIERERRRRRDPEAAAYLWPLTPSGFKRRAAWCAQQAEALRRTR